MSIRSLRCPRAAVRTPPNLTFWGGELYPGGMEVLQRGLGKTIVRPEPPVMSSEDFGVSGRAAGVPSAQLRIGAVDPRVFADAEPAGRKLLLPAPHSPQFAPDREGTIRTGASALTLSVLELLVADR